MPYTETSATADLHATLGPPQRHSLGGVQMLVWTADPAGDGVVMARLSGRELQHGETAMGQVHPARALCEREGRVPRLIVVTVHNGGARDYEQRPDFGLLEDAAEQGWLKFVVWRDPDRMAREPMPAERFYRFVSEQRVDLYLTRLGRRVVWSQDRPTLRTLGVFSAEERELIKSRTHEALISRWLDEGRGWPGAKRFGFRRNPITKYLEVDPDQWEFIKRIHFGYCELPDDGKGLRRLADELQALGCEIGRAQLRRILTDTIYVTGSWTTTYDGTVYPGAAIELDDPIPSEVFLRNQELLRLRGGKNNHTPEGTFCLNAVGVEHAACADQRNAAGLPARLRGRIQAKRAQRAYKHLPWVPTSCRGYRLDQAVLEPAVMAALRELWRSPELAAAWQSSRGLRPQLAVDPLLCPEQLRGLRSRLATLRRQLSRLERSYVDRLAAGENTDERAFGELVRCVREEIDQVAARADATEAGLATLDPRASCNKRDDSGLRQALADLLTDDVPADPRRRVARAAAVKACLERIVVVDEPDGGVRVELHGCLEPSRPQNRER